MRLDGAPIALHCNSKLLMALLCVCFITQFCSISYSVAINLNAVAFKHLETVSPSVHELKFVFIKWRFYRLLN